MAAGVIGVSLFDAVGDKAYKWCHKKSFWVVKARREWGSSLNQSVLACHVSDHLSDRVCHDKDCVMTNLNFCSSTSFIRVYQLRFIPTQILDRNLCISTPFGRTTINLASDFYIWGSWQSFKQVNFKPDTDHSIRCSLDYIFGHWKRTGCTGSRHLDYFKPGKTR